MDAETVRTYFSSEPVLEHYRQATGQVGLWDSEEKIFCRVFQCEDTLLELGCGTGRIAFGLAELGFKNVMGTDFSRAMVTEARRLAQLMELHLPFQVADATALPFEDGLFDGAIFGFNGLMQIPGSDNRKQAMREIRRVVRPGGWFVFTSHDREATQKGFWKKERLRWRKGQQAPELQEFGDRYEKDDLGQLFIHVPAPEEVRAALKETGWRLEADVMRGQLANERPEVRAFADECRFWVAQNPG
ncbi:MAG: class I SAM-dependent methyltransferase [Verrucomicrobiota bacterium]